MNIIFLRKKNTRSIIYLLWLSTLELEKTLRVLQYYLSILLAPNFLYSQKVTTLAAMIE